MIHEAINAAAQDLKSEGKPLTPVWLMYEVMNSVMDDDLNEWGYDICDVADEVLAYLKRNK